MRTEDRREIPYPFVARHRVVGSVLLVLALVAFGVVVGLAVGSVVARILDLVLGIVGGAS